MKEKMPWYHSSDEIHQTISDLSANCQGADVEFTQKSRMNSADAAGTNIDLDVLHVRRKGDQPKTKALFVFGEHARELVSPESGLDFVRNLCGQGRESQRANELLDRVEFTVVPNANPIGRRQVEDGFYCKRTNEDNVDLNRNWGDDHRGNAAMRSGDEMDPGPQGFSEPETQILRDLVAEMKPDVYLSVHSGAYLLGAPYGYTADSNPSNKASMTDILGPISDKYCGGNCPYGGLAELIGYNSEGCDLDYTYEHQGVPYSYTWEIYVGPEIRKHYIAEAHERANPGQTGDEEDSDFFQAQKLNLAQTGSQSSSKKRWDKQRKLRGGHRHRARMATGVGLGEMSEAERPEAEQNPEDCIEQFVPRTQEETESIVDNWTGAYLDLADQVATRQEKKRNEKKDGATQGAAPGPDANGAVESPPPAAAGPEANGVVENPPAASGSEANDPFKSYLSAASVESPPAAAGAEANGAVESSRPASLAATNSYIAEMRDSLRGESSAVADSLNDDSKFAADSVYRHPW